MFYSQFILAKKGPLGTIWIAAHLERKLRKNQVADTDIGVSVDSILFPDAPIALRLSSHLLLGVVRIYSKKVNYLFNDCSEALIKIKHAFRSTAVDLPPEESIAPYHSITLPENFDLDNFELPDSAFLDGNFVDHHVSTREQITLQDTLKDTAFPTSKFGLDEKFGDEDASQIGLELDEELFIEKKVSPKHDKDSMSSKVSVLHHGETSVPSTSMAVDVQFGCDQGKYNEIPNELSELLSNNYDKNFFSGTEDLRRDANSSHRHGYTIQTPDLNETFQPECPTILSPYIPFTSNYVQTPCLVDPAQEPSTPALLEVVPSHFQEVPALSPQDKAEIRVELGRPETCTSPSMEVACSEAGNITIHSSVELDPKFGEDAQRLPLPSALISPMPESVAPTYSNRNFTTDNVCFVSEADRQQSVLVGSGIISEINNVSTADHKIDNEEFIEPSLFSQKAKTLASPPKLAAHIGGEPATTTICTQSMDVSSDIFDVEQRPFKGSTESTETANLNCLKAGDSFQSTSVVGSEFLIRSCGSNLPLSSSPFVQAASPVSSSPFVQAASPVSSSPFVQAALPVSSSPFVQAASPLSSSPFVQAASPLSSSPFVQAASPLSISPFVQAAPFEAELATSNIYTDNVDVSGVILDLKRTSINEPKETSTIERGVDNESCFTTSMVGSDFLSSSRTSNLHLPSSVLVDGDLGEPSELSRRDHCFSQKMPMREEAQQISRSSFEVQGEDFRYSNDRFINLEGQQMSGYTPSDFKYGARKSNELSASVFSKVSHLDSGKYHSNSEFLEPEKMLAPNFVVDSPSYQALQATEKGSTQFNEIFHKNGSQHSRKRRLMDSTSQTSISTEFSALPKSKRTTDYIPGDNDVLASILDERTAPSLKASSIPSLSKVSSQKRPRTMTRVGMPRRRKVLVDDAMVLHAEAIRQQLINTEDIRRMRTKAPCTRPEIWKIYIGAMEHDTFDRPLLTGLSVVLSSLCNLKDDAQRNPSSQTEELNSQVKTSGDKGSSRSLFIEEMDDKEMKETMLSVHNTFNINNGSSNITASASVQTHEADVQVNLYSHLQKLPVQPQVIPFRNDQASVIGSSMALANPNEMGDINERILPFHNIPNRNDGPSNITMPATVRTHEVGAQRDDYLQKVHVHSPVGPFNHNQASVIGSSTVSLFRNEMNDKEINERALSVHGKDGPPSMRESDAVQTHEVHAQYDLSVQPQVGQFSNHQASVICTMQSDRENFSTSITQKSPNPEIGKSFSSVETRCIIQADECNIVAKTSKGIESSVFLKFSSDMSDKEMNERTSSVPSIVNKNVGSSSATASDTVQTHEAGTHCDFNGQLNKLADQPQVGPFGNNQMSMVCALHPDAETRPNSIIQETSISEIDRSVSSAEKYVDKSINLPEGYNFQVKSPEGTGTSRFLESPNEIGDKEMNERIVSPVIVSIIPSATVHSNIDSEQCDLHDQIEKPHVQFELWPFSNDHGSLTCVTQPYAERQANSVILETPICEIDRSLSSVVELTDRSINPSERSLHNNAYNSLNTPNDGSSYAECATLVRIDGDVEVEALTSESLICTENICTAEGAVNREEIADIVVVAKHSAVVVDTDDSVEALRDEGRPESNATSAEQNITSVPRSIDPDSSAMVKNNGMQDCNREHGMDLDMPVAVSAARDTSDFCSAIDDNYPGFLNEDDEENAGLNEADDKEPNAVDAQSVENSGWSTRTRGVARYLKNLFDEESGQGRKSIALNRLLAGKTRKEASRMFFETLVLKTRDYVQVEQEKPFESINIMPRIKLLKSEF